VTAFSANVYQNEYLPEGGSEVNAVISVSAATVGEAAAEAVEVIMVDCSGSMNQPVTKIAAAITATSHAIDKLRDGTWFAVVAGTSVARLVYPTPEADGTGECAPELARATAATRAEARVAVRRLTAGGGTAISTWLTLARRLFLQRPDVVHHAILLTDGRNEGEPAAKLNEEIARCQGVFECDCRGFGTDWDKVELRAIADTLLGTADIIPRAEQMEAEFEALILKAMGRRVSSVLLTVLTPIGTSVRFLKQVSPEMLDLTDRATWQQPSGGLDREWPPVDAIDPLRPLRSTYPTGAWGDGEVREYHICLGAAPQDVGEEHEVRVGRVGLVVDGEEVFHTNVKAIWTDRPELSTRINPKVAHYEGQAELAQAIEEGLEARRRGDRVTATRRLGRAAQIAHESGNEATTWLLRNVVEIEDPERGSVRLLENVSREDEMTLDTRSRRTVRQPKPRPPDEAGS
jgi:hypothetical protein